MKHWIALAKTSFKNIISRIGMTTESVTSVVTKRPADMDILDILGDSDLKCPKIDDGSPRYHKKKMALLMMFSGKGYYGMQMNPGFPCIEGDLLRALLKAGTITKDHFDNIKQTSFQRGSRTDKGVSAAGMVVSLKMFADVPDAVQKINDALPAQIRVLDAIQVTRGFCSKNRADSRSYSYTMPTFAFTPHDQPLKEDFRLSDEILEKANLYFKRFKGQHNFYNYTSGRLVTDASCKRYIMECYAEKPFVKDGLELIVIKVKGQSFMLHQIRKMIGMTIALVQGIVGEDYFQFTFGPERVAVPRAPGVGLMLEQIHYSYYNQKFGLDGKHQPITFEPYKEKIEMFKHEFIYPDMAKAELEDKSMMLWLADVREKHFHGNRDAGATNQDASPESDEDLVNSSDDEMAANKKRHSQTVTNNCEEKSSDATDGKETKPKNETDDVTSSDDVSSTSSVTVEQKVGLPT